VLGEYVRKMIYKGEGNIAGPISPNVLKLPNLTYTISRLLAKIIPVPLSLKVPNIAEIAEFFRDLYLKLIRVRHEGRHSQD
jgi:hypothetical protein